MDGTNQQEQPTKKMKVAELRAELQQRGAEGGGRLPPSTSKRCRAELCRAQCGAVERFRQYSVLFLGTI